MSSCTTKTLLFLFALLLATTGLCGTAKEAASAATPNLATEVATSELPMLLDFGKDGGCPQCVAQAEAIDEIRAQCEGKLTFRFVSVIKEPEAMANYGIFLIPTLVFLDADGNEVDRHVGMLEGDDLIKRFKKLGWLTL